MSAARCRITAILRLESGRLLTVEAAATAAAKYEASNGSDRDRRVYLSFAYFLLLFYRSLRRCFLLLRDSSTHNVHSLSNRTGPRFRSRSAAVVEEPTMRSSVYAQVAAAVLSTDGWSPDSNLLMPEPMFPRIFEATSEAEQRVASLQ